MSVHKLLDVRSSCLPRMIKCLDVSVTLSCPLDTFHFLLLFLPFCACQRHVDALMVINESALSCSYGGQENHILFTALKSIHGGDLFMHEFFFFFCGTALKGTSLTWMALRLPWRLAPRKAYSLSTCSLSRHTCQF